jgi:prephenate dehydrogenase
VRRIADRLVIAGVGLIGGSLAAALKSHGAVGEVIGIGRTRENLRIAKQRGLIDRIATDPVEAARDADMLVVATPVQAIAPLVALMAHALPPRAVITDAGSVKAPVVAAVERALGRQAARFCGSHPIAGTESSGAAAARADLLAGARCILTPTARTAASTRRHVRTLWEAAGMRVEEMPARLHDRLLARVSHLPHVIAYALVNAVADAERDHGRRLLSYAGGGFGDSTRVAASSPEMWRDICVANRDEVLRAIDDFLPALARLRDAIEVGDRDTLEAELARAQSVRRRLAAMPRPAPRRGTVTRLSTARARKP